MVSEAAVETELRTADRFLGPYRVLRGNRDLSLLFGSQVVSALGDWLYIVALIVVVYDITRSATVVALLTFVRLLPYALFLPISGILADRLNRKWLMIGADLGRGACMLGLLGVHSRATLPMAFILVFAATSMSSLFRPALNSSLPAVVASDDLVLANSLMSQMDSLSFVLGPALGGVFVLLGHAQTAFLITGITALCSALTLLFLHMPARVAATHPEEGGWLAETLAGFRFLFPENRGVLAAFTLTMAGITLLDGAFWTLSVVLPLQAFHLGEQGTGFLNAAYGVGGLMGGMMMGPLLGRIRIGRFFILVATVSCIVASLFGISPAGALPFVFLAIVGIADVAVQVTGTTVVQTATPGALLGRVFAAFESTLIFSMLLGALLVGPLIALFGARGATVAFALTGVVVLLASLPAMSKMEDVLGVRIFLRQVPVLTTLSLHVLDDLASRLHSEHYPAGTAIVREGDVGDKLYIVQSGTVEVVARAGSRDEVRVAELSTRDYFGETALLRDLPRTATVRSVTPVELYSLSRADFQELLRRSRDFQAAVSGTSDARYIATQSRLLTRL